MTTFVSTVAAFGSTVDTFASRVTPQCCCKFVGTIDWFAHPPPLQIIQLTHIIKELNLMETLMPSPTNIYSDNAACVCWAHGMTTNSLCHVQMCKNADRKHIQ